MTSRLQKHYGPVIFPARPSALTQTGSAHVKPLGAVATGICAYAPKARCRCDRRHEMWPRSNG